MKKKVYICAPLGGNIKENLQNAVIYTKFALKSGVAPVTPHFYALSLDDNNKSDQELGRSAGMSLLWFCDEMWIFGDTVTEGMRAEINFCKNLNVKMRTVRPHEINKVIGGKNK